MPIDESKFLEPTKTYIEKFGLKQTKHIKLWFNLDLIHIAKQCKDAPPEDKDNAYQSYSFWLNEMGVEYSINEIYERFKDYPEKEFSKLFKLLLKHF